MFKRHGIPSSVTIEVTTRLAIDRSGLACDVMATEATAAKGVPPEGRWIVRVQRPGETEDEAAEARYLYWSGAIGIQSGPRNTAHRAETREEAAEMIRDARKALARMSPPRLELTGLQKGDVFKRVRVHAGWS